MVPINFLLCQNTFDTTAMNAKVTLVKIIGKPDQLSFGYGGPFTKEYHWKFPFQISWQKQFLQQNLSTLPIVEYINTQYQPTPVYYFSGKLVAPIFKDRL